jgi:predicted nuclease of restriction endonuclease-like (RecB) superfamily
MSKAPKSKKPCSLTVPSSPPVVTESDFDVVLALIEAARTRAVTAANTTLIDLYWNIGEYISRKVAEEEWGRGTVEALAVYIQRRRPGASGFSASNLWRMRQFFETYRNQPKLAPLVRELSWTHNLLIMSRCKRDEEREFYLRLCQREKWGKRELERQLAGAFFERTVLSPPKLAPAVRELHPDAASVFKDTYLIEFLDLLFFNRALNALVDIELKVEEFQPEHLGKLEFCLEALDRDVRKPHERPSIGVLLCATKDHEVVEYALSRAMSPALVAEYQTCLPDKKLLQTKLHEFYQLAESEAATSAKIEIVPPPVAQLPGAKKQKPPGKKQPKKERQR